MPPKYRQLFSSAYSMIFARTRRGIRFELNIRQMILAEIPVPLCSADKIVQAVLRGNPSAFACASSETNPAVIKASPIPGSGRLSRLHIRKRGIWSSIAQEPRARILHDNLLVR